MVPPRWASFSPVAGIQWVETQGKTNGKSAHACFSPVAGIQWVETWTNLCASSDSGKFQSRCRDSVG